MQPMAAPAQAPGPMAAPQPGGSFLGTAAAAAAGVIGGSLLMGGIRSMMGGHQGGAHAAYDPAAGGSGGGSPWSGGSGNIAGSDLSRQAGLDDMGRAPSTSGGGGGDQRQGLLGDGGSDAALEHESDAAGFEDDSGFDLDDGGGSFSED